VIDIENVESIHNAIIEDTGGSKGIRDVGSLLAALARPYMTFDQQELYPNPSEKAAAIFESLIINHPFIDGNKRIANFLLRLTLLEFDWDILSFDDERYKMTIDASSGTIRFDEIKQWIEDRLIKINP